MSTTNMRRRPGKLFAALQACYGAFTALGSCGELAVTLAPGALPDDALLELALLHGRPGVEGWVFAQNLASLPLALGLLVAAIGLWRRLPWALAWTRSCAIAMLVVLALGQFALGLLLYPSLLDESVDIESPLAWLVMLVFAGLAAMVWPGFAVFATSPRRAASRA